MSFVFRGTRVPDIENGLSGFIPERRAMVCSIFYTLDNTNAWKFVDIAIAMILILKKIFFSAHNQRVHAARPVNSNSLAFLVTGTISPMCRLISVSCDNFDLLHCFNS